MLKTLKTIRDCTLSAKDGEIGMVRDIFFDDEHWIVRYLVANTSSWLLGRNVLILPRSLGSLDNFHRTITVDLTRQQVKDSPDVDTDQPVSRAAEISYHRYMGLPIYWGGVGDAIPALPEPQFPFQENVPEGKQETHLRSARELEGYHVEAVDGRIGHVDELLINPDDWHIAYLVLKTKEWLPGKMVTVPTYAFRHVDWIDRSIQISLGRAAIEAAPEFNISTLESGALDAELSHHFGTHSSS